MGIPQVGLWIAILMGFGFAAETTLRRPEHNIEVEQRRAKAKYKMELEQVIIIDKIERHGEYYRPVKDTIYIFRD